MKARESPYKTDLPDRHTKEYYSLLLDHTAINLLNLVPSEIKNEDIQELEKTLNSLYSQSYLENWPDDIQDAILEALSRAAELSDIINNLPATTPRSREFFKTLKKFTPQLQMIAAFLID